MEVNMAYLLPFVATKVPMEVVLFDGLEESYVSAHRLGRGDRILGEHTTDKERLCRHSTCQISGVNLSIGRTYRT